MEIVILFIGLYLPIWVVFFILIVFARKSLNKQSLNPNKKHSFPIITTHYSELKNLNDYGKSKTTFPQPN